MLHCGTIEQWNILTWSIFIGEIFPSTVLSQSIQDELAAINTTHIVFYWLCYNCTDNRFSIPSHLPVVLFCCIHEWCTYTVAWSITIVIPSPNLHITNAYEGLRGKVDEPTNLVPLTWEYPKNVFRSCKKFHFLTLYSQGIMHVFVVVFLQYLIGLVHFTYRPCICGSPV